jgi:NADPH-dependent 2,4-dienoyl-CoA reductase/sulfur reductase-like enzyme
MMPQKVVVIGAGPVGSLAALYAAIRGHEVEIYDLRSGRLDRVLKTNHLVANVP